MPSLQTPTSDLGFRVISRFSTVLEGMLLSCRISASLALNFDQLKKDYIRATHWILLHIIKAWFVKLSKEVACGLEWYSECAPPVTPPDTEFNVQRNQFWLISKHPRSELRWYRTYTLIYQCQDLVAIHFQQKLTTMIGFVRNWERREWKKILEVTSKGAAVVLEIFRGNWFFSNFLNILEKMENLEICIAFLISFCEQMWDWVVGRWIYGRICWWRGSYAGPTTHPRLFRCVSISARCDSTSNYYLSQPRHNTGGIVPLVVSQGMIRMRETWILYWENPEFPKRNQTKVWFLKKEYSLLKKS